MSDATATEPCYKQQTEQPNGATAALVLSNGTIFWGKGIGQENSVVGEICFNTSMTGYQEIITDPSYAGQIITFTFPHVGNVGINPNDLEHFKPSALGIILRSDVTPPSNYRSTQNFSEWLEASGLTGITGIDTRSLTRCIRKYGAVNVAISFSKTGCFDLNDLKKRAQDCPSLIGMDLATKVSCSKVSEWSDATWHFGTKTTKDGYKDAPDALYHVVAIDYGAKRNILRNLTAQNAQVTVVPARTSAKDILKLRPDGVFLSNGPGDPAATAVYAIPIIQELLKTGTPIFGICLGHQLLSLALGAKTEKMKNGHRGANHPVKELRSGKIEITSQNHGFVITENSLPPSAVITHRSLFDGSIEGFKIKDKYIFSVQYHPEASPGPTESDYLFHNFLELIKEAKNKNHA